VKNIVPLYFPSIALSFPALCARDTSSHPPMNLPLINTRGTYKRKLLVRGNDKICVGQYNLVVFKSLACSGGISSCSTTVAHGSIIAIAYSYSEISN